MRKNFTLVLLAAAFVSTLFTSCTKENLVPSADADITRASDLDLLRGDKHKTDHEARHAQLQENVNETPRID